MGGFLGKREGKASGRRVRFATKSDHSEHRERRARRSLVLAVANGERTAESTPRPVLAVALEPTVQPGRTPQRYCTTSDHARCTMWLVTESKRYGDALAAVTVTYS